MIRLVKNMITEMGKATYVRLSIELRSRGVDFLMVLDNEKPILPVKRSGESTETAVEMARRG